MPQPNNLPIEKALNVRPKPLNGHPEPLNGRSKALNGHSEPLNEEVMGHDHPLL